MKQAWLSGASLIHKSFCSAAHIAASGKVEVKFLRMEER
jgi:hypothetical protein